MEARYSKFLQSGLKIYGVDIQHFFVIIVCWILCRFFHASDLVTLGIPSLVAGSIFYYKRNYTPDFIYFICMKRKYSIILVRESVKAKTVESFSMKESLENN
jgi:hypothetical protein